MGGSKPIAMSKLIDGADSGHSLESSISSPALIGEPAVTLVAAPWYVHLAPILSSLSVNYAHAGQSRLLRGWTLRPR